MTFIQKYSWFQINVIIHPFSCTIIPLFSISLFYMTRTWHGTRMKKTFSGQVCGCKIKNITENECFNFISKRILLLLRCMTKPVVMINNVLEAQSSCVRAFCTRKVHVSSNEYNALLYIPSVIQLFCMVFFVARHIQS